MIGEGAWRLTDVRVPACLVTASSVPRDRDGFARLDITIAEGVIASLVPAGTETLDGDLPQLPRGGAIAMPGFVDAHTHLDKGHIWHRTPNPDGTFLSAREAASRDRVAHWSADDLRTRMRFALDCAYQHGTVAIRTHLDSPPEQIATSWPVFAEMRDEWRDRITLQASPLIGIDRVLDDAVLAEVVAAVRAAGTHVLGAVTYIVPETRAGLEKIMRVAADNGFDLDFHADETNDPAVNSLRLIADMAIETRFPGRILAGHCCSLAVQDTDEARRTIDRVAQAGIAVVSLPLCNLYLQDRSPADRVPLRTPRWRGVTLLHELKAAGVSVMVASDNTRDPFYAYGDLDMVEVWREATRIAHLDHPLGDWPAAVTATPADILRLQDHGRMAVGAAADFVLFSARSPTELFARPQTDRLVVRKGRALNKKAPSYDRLSGIV